MHQYAPFAIYNFKFFSGVIPLTPLRASGRPACSDPLTKVIPSHRQFLEDPPLQLATKKGQLKVKQTEAEKLIST